MYLCCNMDSENFKRNLFACLLNGLTIPPPFSFNLLHMLMPCDNDKKTAKPTINPTLNFETNKNRANTKEQKRREKNGMTYIRYISLIVCAFSVIM